MNKTITTAFEAVKTNPTDENIKALADLAVPKFRDYYGRVAKAVRTINRHLGVNKGNPNRATIATAIGLADEFKVAREIADLIKMPEMDDAADLALNNITIIKGMRANRAYDHIDVMTDFYTNAEVAVRNAERAKVYLYNITNAVKTATDTINRHIVDGTFDVNTFKVAKVLGYADEVAPLINDLNTYAVDDATKTIVTTDDVDAAKAVETAIVEITNSRDNGFRLAVATIPEYDPFPNEGEDEETEEELNATEAE